jgi:glycerophosphoryl diester phosphodiesterase
MSLDEALRLPAPLNLETKVHDTGLSVDDAATLARLVIRRVQAADAGARVTLQSFDWRALTVAHREAPWLQTVALVGDRSVDMPEATRAGLPWADARTTPRVGRSAGFENLALTKDGRHLIAMLEKPLPGDSSCLAFRFDLATKRWAGVAFRYPLDPRATAVGDLTFVDERSGYALERDDSERRTDGFKRLVRFMLPLVEGGEVTKHTAADLLDLELPDGGTFSFPFWTIEGVAVLPKGRVAIINDNNLPFGRGRSEDAPDPTELIVVEPR